MKFWLSVLSVCLVSVAASPAFAMRTWSSPGWYVWGNTLNTILDLRTMVDGPFGSEPECNSAKTYYSPTTFIYSYQCGYFTEDPDFDPVSDYDRLERRQKEDVDESGEYNPL